MRSLLILPSLFLLSHCIINGHVDEWNKYAHLVKVLARSSPSSSPLACSGTLISPKLVLTSSDCVMEGGQQVSEVMVLVSRPSKPAVRKRASIVHMNGTLAYLALAHPMHVGEICPGGIPTDRGVARLSITPSLVRSPITPFDWVKIEATTCRMVAFETVENVDGFLNSASVQTAVLKVEVEEERLTVRRMDTAVPAPCFEDAGAPFECLVGDQFIQVGLFSSLYALDDGEEHRHKRDEKEVKEDTTTSTSTTTSTTTTTTPEPTNAPTDATNETKEEETSKKDDENTEVDSTSTTTTTPEPTNAHTNTTNAPKNEVEKDVFSRCRTASTLRFTRLDTVAIAAVIEKHDFVGFVNMYEGCGLIL